MTTSTAYCVCGWKEEEVSSLPRQCPQCGCVNIGAVVMGEDEREGPSEFVFSEEQKQRSWPEKFWRQLWRRIRDRELYMNPHELARWGMQLIPGMRDRRAPGRPRGGPFRDQEDFEARLTEIIEYLHKHHYVITHELIACTLRQLLRAPKQPEGLASVVTEAARERKDAKTALQNLKRWCDNPKHPVDLDQLIRRVTIK
jgi:hypothetical protein